MPCLVNFGSVHQVLLHKIFPFFHHIVSTRIGEEGFVAQNIHLLPSYCFQQGVGKKRSSLWIIFYSQEGYLAIWNYCFFQILLLIDDILSALVRSVIYLFLWESLYLILLIGWSNFLFNLNYIQSKKNVTCIRDTDLSNYFINHFLLKKWSTCHSCSFLSRYVAKYLWLGQMRKNWQVSGTNDKSLNCASRAFREES